MNGDNVLVFKFAFIRVYLRLNPCGHTADVPIRDQPSAISAMEVASILALTWRRDPAILSRPR